MSITRSVLAAMLVGGLVAIGTVALAAAVGGDDPSGQAASRLTGTPTDVRAVSIIEYPDPRPRPNPVRAALLPNLQSLPPEDVLIEVADGERRLRFTSIIANTGAGPIETNPDGLLPCPPGERHASQVLYHDEDDDGRYDRSMDTATTSRLAGCMLDHDGHSHWHFDAAAKYTLVEPRGGAPVAVADKVSFCWRDNREVPAEADPRPKQHYGDCSYDTVQGITPGWADVYGEQLDDQHLDLPTDLADGVYCLWNEADPLDLLRETDDTDNAAVTAIEIRGTDVAEAPRQMCVPSAPEGR